MRKQVQQFNRKTFFKSFKCFIFGHKWILQGSRKTEERLRHDTRLYVDKEYTYYYCPYCNSRVRSSNKRKRPDNSKREFWETLEDFINEVLE